MKLSGSEGFDVLFCDNHLLIAVKPAGWLTQPDHTDRPSLETSAKAWVKKEFEKPAGVFLHCIHRIDRPVSGLVMFARTSKALSRMNELSRAGTIRRFYCAEVEGVLFPKEGTLEHLMVHGDHKAIVGKHPEAKKAVLIYKVLEQREHTALVQVELVTGRYHQIRAQFGAIKHPILFDGKYGAQEKKETIHLACTDIQFQHPITREELSFHYEAPF